MVMVTFSVRTNATSEWVSPRMVRQAGHSPQPRRRDVLLVAVQGRGERLRGVGTAGPGRAGEKPGVGQPFALGRLAQLGDDGGLALEVVPDRHAVLLRVHGQQRIRRARGSGRRVRRRAGGRAAPDTSPAGPRPGPGRPPGSWRGIRRPRIPAGLRRRRRRCAGCRPTAGSTSSSTVRSGCRPDVAQSLMSRTASVPRSRPAPWYATEESMYRSVRTISPRSRAGRMTWLACAARDAAKIRASVWASMWPWP